MFSFTAKAADIPIETGVVAMTVKDVESSTVKTEGSANFGKDMMICHLELADKNGNKKTVREYFVISDEFIKKLGFFCQALGVYQKYLTGNLDKPDLMGKSGQCEIEKIDKTIDGNEVKVVHIKKFLKKKK